MTIIEEKANAAQDGFFIYLLSVQEYLIFEIFPMHLSLEYLSTEILQLIYIYLYSLNLSFYFLK